MTSQDYFLFLKVIERYRERYSFHTVTYKLWNIIFQSTFPHVDIIFIVINFVLISLVAIPSLSLCWYKGTKESIFHNLWFSENIICHYRDYFRNFIPIFSKNECWYSVMWCTESLEDVLMFYTKFEYPFWYLFKSWFLKENI